MMKFIAVLLTSTAALAAHANADDVSATATPAPAPPTCNSSVIAPIYNISAARTLCTFESGYWFVPPSSPSDKDLPKICASEACKTVFKAALEQYPGECTVNLGSAPILYRKDLLDRVNGVCKFFTPTPKPTPTPTPKPTPPPTCVSSAISPIYKLSADRTACTSESGYWFVPPSSPTDKDLPKICASPACKRVFTAAITANPTECTVNLGTAPILYRKDLLDRVNTACKFVLPPTPAPTVAPTPTPKPTPPPPCVATAIAPIYSISANRTVCTYESGYWFVPASRPSDSDVVKICASDACKQVFSTALALNPKDCTVTIGGDPIAYRADLLDRVNGVCKFYKTA